jgi:hypothetical protein
VKQQNGFDIGIIPASFNLHGNGESKVENWKEIISGFNINWFGIACRQFIDMGRIDPGVVDQLLSYPGVSRNDATVDYLLSSAEDEIEDVYEDVLARVFQTGVVTPKVMRMILTARLKYLQHVIPMCELLSLSNPNPKALESLRELNAQANQFFSRIRPNVVGDLLPTSQR